MKFSLRKLNVTLFTVVFAFLICSPNFLVFIGKAETSALVWVDKKEYFPDEIASVFGYGFNPFTNATIHIVRPDLVEHYVYTVTDEFGYFSCEYQLDGVHGTYSLTATDGVNSAATTFDNCLHLKVQWYSCCCWYIHVRAVSLRKWKSYYVKYYDPNGVERRESPTHTGVHWFKDNFTLLPSLPYILGTWTVELYEDSTLIRTKTICISKMVWTTDPTYNNLVTSFAQDEAVYYKAIGLKTSKYYRFMFEKPSGTRFSVGDWITGVTNLTGNYILPSTAEIGSWKLHVREASDSAGTGEHHYVDTCYFEVTTTPTPPQYYLTVQTDPSGVTTIPGEGWYIEYTYVNLTAPELLPGPSDGIRYKFYYWDVNSASQGEGVSSISVYMDNNYTATAHYLTQYYLNMTSNPATVTIPTGSGWYNESESAQIFAPEFVGIMPGESRYRFNGWTTIDMSEIANPSATSTTVFMDKAKTVTANYKVQYQTCFDDTGVSSDFTSTVVTVNGSNYNVADLPVYFWWDENSSHSFTFHSPLVVTSNTKRYIWISTSGLSSQQSDTITITTHGNIVGNYKTQYYLTLTTNPLGVTTPSGEGWYDKGEYASISTDEFMNITPGSSRYRFNTWTTSNMSEITNPNSPATTVHMDEAKTVTANYVVQYSITFDQTGLDNTTAGTIVTVNSALKTYGDLPFSIWIDENSQVTYAYENTVASTTSGKKFILIDVTGPASPITATGHVDVVGNYKVQYLLIVQTNGLDTYVTNVYNDTNLLGTATDVTPYQEWFDEGSFIQLNIDSPITDGSKRLVFTNWSGDASGSDRPLPVTMNSANNITANYKTRYYLIVTSAYDSPTPTSNWYDAGTHFDASVTSPWSGPTGVRYVCTGWNGTGSVPLTGTTTSVSFIINEPSNITWNWETQYYLTVQTDPPDITTILGEGWHNCCETVELTAPTVAGYEFRDWDVDGDTVPSNPIQVYMNESHIATAHYISVCISPQTAKIKVGESVTFTSTVSGGQSPYNYQWFLNETAVSGATHSEWIFEPTCEGFYMIYLNVTDDLGKTVKSNEASVTVAPPLTVSIFPTSGLIPIGDSIEFTSAPSGGYPPYSYQWYLDSNPVPGANSETWTFTPTEIGTYYVYLKVTDANNNIAQSETAKITFWDPSIGGYSISLSRNEQTSHLINYTMLITFFGVALSLLRRKKK